LFTLYTTPLSANGRKVLVLTQHLGLEPEIRWVNVYRGEGRTPAYLAIHPSGKIPALVDGEFVLWESNAILQYVSEVYGGFRLSSRDPRQRADIARWLFWEAAHWQPALTSVLSAFVGHRLLPDMLPAPAGPPDWADPQLEPLLGLLGAHLANRSFLVGASLSIADLGVAGMMTYFRAAAFPFERFPALAAWFARIESLEAWMDTAVAPWA
jgi:glutathione S-transferase